MKPIRLLSVLLLPALLLGACSASTGPAATKADEAALRLVPASASVVVRIENLQALDGEVQKIAGMFQPAMAQQKLLQTQIGGAVLMNPQLAGVAVDQPIVLAVVSNPESPMPSILWIVPVDDEQAYRTAVEGDSRWKMRSDRVGLRFLEGHALFSDDKALVSAVTAGTAAPAWAQGAKGSVFVAVDVESLTKVYDEQIQTTLAQMESIADSPQIPEAAQPMLEPSFALMRTLVDDAKRIGMSADLKDGDLSFEMSFTAKAGSELATFMADSGAAPVSSLGRLGKTGLMFGEIHMSPAAMRTVLSPVFGMFSSFMDEDLTSIMLESATLYDGAAFNASLADGMAMSCVYHVTDPERFQEVMDELMNRMGEYMDDVMEAMKAMSGPNAPPFEFDVGEMESFEHGDVEVKSLSVGMSFPEGQETPPQVDEMMRMMFGGDRMVYYMATVGDEYMFTMGPGGKAEIGDLIDRAGETAELPATVKAALEGCPEKVNLFLSMDFGELARFVAKVMPEGMVPDATKALLTSPPAGLSISGYVAMEGDTAHTGFRLKLVDIISYVQGIMESAQPR